MPDIIPRKKHRIYNNYKNKKNVETLTGEQINCFLEIPGCQEKILDTLSFMLYYTQGKKRCKDERYFEKFSFI